MIVRRSSAHNLATIGVKLRGGRAKDYDTLLQARLYVLAGAQLKQGSNIDWISITPTLPIALAVFFYLDTW